MPHTLLIPKGSRGGAKKESGAAPYSVDKGPEEGLVGAPQKCSRRRRDFCVSKKDRLSVFLE